MKLNYILLLIILLTAVFFVSGCTSQNVQQPSETPTPTLSEELTAEIENSINENYVIYIDVNNVVYSNDILKIMYVSSDAGFEPSIYGQMVEVMKQTITYLEKKNLHPNKIEFKATHFLTEKSYDITLTYNELKDYGQANLDFNYWKNKVTISSSK